MKKITLVLSLFSISLLSCSKSDDNLYEDSVCDQITEVDNNKYKNNLSQGFQIARVQIMADCLQIEIEASGCDGNTWKVDLIDAGRVAESNPEQRDLKLLVKNEELCNSIVSKTYTFDLRPIRTNNGDILLNLKLWDEQILYDY